MGETNARKPDAKYYFTIPYSIFWFLEDVEQNHVIRCPLLQFQCIGFVDILFLWLEYFVDFL